MGGRYQSVVWGAAVLSSSDDVVVGPLRVPLQRVRVVELLQADPAEVGAHRVRSQQVPPAVGHAGEVLAAPPALPAPARQPD